MPSEQNTILKGKIFPPLIKFTIPLMLSILLQALYGAVDLIIVGKFGSTVSVSAVSNGSQVMHTVTGVITGLTMGVTVLVGRFIGANDEASAAKTAGAGAKLFAIVAAVITVVLFVLSKSIVDIMKVPDQAVDQAVVYIRVCSVGMIFIVAFNAISGLFRGVGNSKSPLLFIAIACCVNIVCDLILIGIFKLDAVGAAIATVLAQAVSVVFSLVKIKHGGLLFKVTREDFKNSGKKIREIIKIGGPIAAQDGLVSTSFLILMGIINTLGLVASASIGIAEKMFLFLSIVPMSFMLALSAFVAQNIGARQEQRALKATRIAMGVSVCFGTCMFLLTYFEGDLLASCFEKNTAVINATADYLRGVSVEYLLIAITFCFLGYFNGVGKTRFVLVEGIISSFLVRIPLSYYFSLQPDANLYDIALAVPASAVVSLILCASYFLYIKKRRLK